MSAIAEHRTYAVVAAAVLGAVVAWSGCGGGSGSDGGPAGCGAECAGTCTGGSRCLVTLASGQNNPGRIAVDSTSAYWSSATDGVMKVALDGGTPANIGPIGTAEGIAVAGTSVYWTDTGSGSAFSMPADVRKVSLDGGAMTVLAPGGYMPRFVTVDTTHVYWTELGTCPTDGGPCEQQQQACPPDGGTCSPGYGTVQKVALDGGAVTTLASGVGNPSGIAVDSTDVYWTDSSSGTVMKVSLAGGAPVTLATGRKVPVGLAVDAVSVYWTDLGTPWLGPGSAVASYDGAVMKVGLDGGTMTTLASGQLPLGVIAVDGTSVYWANELVLTPTIVTILKVPVGGGAPTKLASGGEWCAGLTVDSTSLYWTNQSLSPQYEGSVMKLTPK